MDKHYLNFGNQTAYADQALLDGLCMPPEEIGNSLVFGSSQALLATQALDQKITSPPSLWPNPWDPAVLDYLKHKEPPYNVNLAATLSSNPETVPSRLVVRPAVAIRPLQPPSCMFLACPRSSIEPTLSSSSGGARSPLQMRTESYYEHDTGLLGIPESSAPLTPWSYQQMAQHYDAPNNYTQRRTSFGSHATSPLAATTSCDTITPLLATVGFASHCIAATEDLQTKPTLESAMPTPDINATKLPAYEDKSSDLAANSSSHPEKKRRQGGDGDGDKPGKKAHGTHTSLSFVKVEDPSKNQVIACPSCSGSHFFNHDVFDIHAAKEHARTFSCVFHLAGCTAVFSSKNEWKRHVKSQHLVLNFWVCEEGLCGSGRDKVRPCAAPRNPQAGDAIFNRKDLFTQHIRRMHAPPQMRARPACKKEKGGGGRQPPVRNPEWDRHLRALQEGARRVRCTLPERMACMACDAEFFGADAWDQRMEHLARHMARAARGAEAPVVLGGPEDPTLTDWASRPEVGVIVWREGGGWTLGNPLKRAKGKPVERQNECESEGRGSEVEDKDAKGEECDCL